MLNKIGWIFFITGAGLAASGCSSAEKKEGLQRQHYARLSDRRTFEKEMPAVWKAISSTVEVMPILKREETHPSERSLETDWVIEESREKYYRYTINGSPRQKKIRSRFKYLVAARSVIGGVEVHIKNTEEVEKLKKDGTADGFSKVDDREVDTTRPANLLDKVGAALLTDSGS